VTNFFADFLSPFIHKLSHYHDAVTALPSPSYGNHHSRARASYSYITKRNAATAGDGREWQSAVRTRYSVVQKRHDWLLDHPSHRSSFSGEQMTGRESHHSRLSRTDTKNKYRNNFNSSFVFMTCKAKNFTYFLSLLC
jgi:hypothetical protein